MSAIDFFVVLGVGFGLGIVGLSLLRWMYRRRRSGGSQDGSRCEVHVIAERVQALSRLVGLEVSAKEIATARKGVSWMPPLILSQARLAMIFQFEKQYAVDLSAIGPGHVEDLGEGRFVLRMPEIRGTLRLIDVTPYDIQDGRVLGLLDVIQMNASAQKALMEKAQEQAGGLFEANDARYVGEARASIERQLASLLALFDAEVEIVWDSDEPAMVQPEPRLALSA